MVSIDGLRSLRYLNEKDLNVKRYRKFMQLPPYIKGHLREVLGRDGLIKRGEITNGQLYVVLENKDVLIGKMFSVGSDDMIEYSNALHFSYGQDLDISTTDGFTTHVSKMVPIVNSDFEKIKEEYKIDEDKAAVVFNEKLRTTFHEHI